MTRSSQRRPARWDKNLRNYKFAAGWAPPEDGEDDLDLTRKLHPALLGRNSASSPERKPEKKSVKSSMVTSSHITRVTERVVERRRSIDNLFDNQLMREQTARHPREPIVVQERDPPKVEREAVGVKEIQETMERISLDVIENPVKHVEKKDSEEPENEDEEDEIPTYDPEEFYGPPPTRKLYELASAVEDPEEESISSEEEEEKEKEEFEIPQWGPSTVQNIMFGNWKISKRPKIKRRELKEVPSDYGFSDVQIVEDEVKVGDVAYTLDSVPRRASKDRGSWERLQGRATVEEEKLPGDQHESVKLSCKISAMEISEMLSYLLYPEKRGILVCNVSIQLDEKVHVIPFYSNDRPDSWAKMVRLRFCTKYLSDEWERSIIDRLDQL